MTTVRTAVVGCGSVSNSYLLNLSRNGNVQMVAVCDQRPDMVRRQAETYGVTHAYDDVNAMLKEQKLDLLVNLTSMNEHAPINRLALEAGVNVWCEKPIATDVQTAFGIVELAKKKGVGVWAAPNSPASPAFLSMANILKSGEIGRAYVAHGIYGHSGPSWSPWFYKQGGGSLRDLGVYNVTTLAALLGPVRAVTAMAGTAIPVREVQGETIQAEADDNVALIMDHGDCVFSVVQTGFVYGRQLEDWTIQVIGTKGTMALMGYDWEPRGVRVSTGPGESEIRGSSQDGYEWAGGASYIAECLVAGKRPLFDGMLGVHVLEIMAAALQSAATGRRMQIESTFALTP